MTVFYIDCPSCGSGQNIGVYDAKDLAKQIIQVIEDRIEIHKSIPSNEISFALISELNWMQKQIKGKVGLDNGDIT